MYVLMAAENVLDDDFGLGKGDVQQAFTLYSVIQEVIHTQDDAEASHSAKTMMILF